MYNFVCDSLPTPSPNQKTLTVSYDAFCFLINLLFFSINSRVCVGSSYLNLLDKFKTLYCH